MFKSNYQTLKNENILKINDQNYSPSVSQNPIIKHHKNPQFSNKKKTSNLKIKLEE